MFNSLLSRWFTCWCLLFCHVVPKQISNPGAICSWSFYVQGARFCPNARSLWRHEWSKIKINHAAQRRSDHYYITWWCQRGFIFKRLWNFMGKSKSWILKKNLKICLGWSNWFCSMCNRSRSSNNSNVYIKYSPNFWFSRSYEGSYP